MINCKLSFVQHENVIEIYAKGERESKCGIERQRQGEREREGERVSEREGYSFRG